MVDDGSGGWKMRLGKVNFVGGHTCICNNSGVSVSTELRQATYFPKYIDI
jgi:hypothetical protein